MLKIVLTSACITLVVAVGFLMSSNRFPTMSIGQRAKVVVPGAEAASPRRSGGIFAPGWVEGATDEVELRPETAGRVAEVKVREGEYVTRGQVLLSLEEEARRHDVDLAAADLALAEAELERLLNGARPEERAEAAALHRVRLAELKGAQQRYRRTKSLRERNAVAEQEADDQQAALEAKLAEAEAAEARQELLEAPAREDEVAIHEAQVAAAEARLGQARHRLAQTQLTAAHDGQVLQVNLECGELTGPDAAQPAIVMVDTNTLCVRAWVEEFDAPRVRVGMQATIEVDGLPGREFTGRVSRIRQRMGKKQLTSDQASERFDVKVREVWIDIDRTEDLIIGLRVDVTIHSDEPAATPKSPPRNQPRSKGEQP